MTEVGATLRSYAVGDVEVVDGFGLDEPSSAGRGQVLAPWPNRLDGGRYAFEGRQGRAPIDEPERGNAIHGLVRWLPWLGRLDGGGRCLADVRPARATGVPVAARARDRLPPRSGRAAASGSARRTRRIAAAPFGLGFHPYVTVGVPVDEIILSMPASRRLVTDEPSASRSVRRTSPAPGSTSETARADRRDHARHLLRGPAFATRTDGFRARVEAEARAASRSGRAKGSAISRRTPGDTLEPVSRRRKAIALEPMTCPPNASRVRRST